MHDDEISLSYPNYLAAIVNLSGDESLDKIDFASEKYRLEAVIEYEFLL